MKILSRDFTTTEKILIALLFLLLLGLVYYQFVDRNVRSATSNAKVEAQSLEMQIDEARQRAEKLRNLQNTLDKLEAQGKLSYMGSYNNSKAEVRFLNDLLADTLTYSIEFSSVTRNGNQIRRSFKLKYQTGGFRAAREIIENLLKSENRCLVSDMSCSIQSSGVTDVEANATFYETMVGGTPDAGLPADAAAANY